MEDIYRQIESNVRFYCRSWPTSFCKAKLHNIYDETGKCYVDFFAGSGSLSYGHNNPILKRAVLKYLRADGIVQSLDMNTKAKRCFFETFDSLILNRLMDRYKIMCTGPTGADAVEAALRLAKKVTGRRKVAAWVGGFHGMTTGALAISSGSYFEKTTLPSHAEDTIFLPFQEEGVEPRENIDAIEATLDDLAEAPAAFVFETVQAEGGVLVAERKSLKNLEKICRDRGILTILDDVQMGCGRTGPFFSSEHDGLRPDLIVLSKSLGAFGIPLSIVLLKTELDIWKPGEHTGTFRGQNLAFVAGQTALAHYWSTPQFENKTSNNGFVVFKFLREIKSKWPDYVRSIRGQGLMYGIEFVSAGLASDAMNSAFKKGLLIERCGKERKVLKICPPLTISKKGLTEGLIILTEAVRTAVTKAQPL